MITYTSLFESLKFEFEAKLNRSLEEGEMELLDFMAQTHFQHLYSRKSEDLFLEQL